MIFFYLLIFYIDFYIFCSLIVIYVEICERTRWHIFAGKSLPLQEVANAMAYIRGKVMDAAACLSFWLIVAQFLVDCSGRVKQR